MQVSLSRDRFVALATSNNLIPIATEVMADHHTPVSVHERLAGDGDGFLLESVEGGERWARWSFIGWNPAGTIRAVDGVVDVDTDLLDLPDGLPLDALQAVTDAFVVPDDGELGFGAVVPPLHSGAVGFLAYDAVRYVEHLPNRPHDDRGLPEMLWQLVGGLAAFDRLRDTIVLVANVFVGPDPEADYDAGVAFLTETVARLCEPMAPDTSPRPRFEAIPDAETNLTRGEFETAVLTAIDHIRAGDAFQIVPSIRFTTSFNGDPMTVYRALRVVNPSPFMFLVRSGDVSIIGSSPELMARVRDGRAYSRPIAGTRPRGATPEEDRAFEDDLLSDPKELAEHVMLIDLARNDLGRVCRYGSVEVDDLMVIERYSHVMHIVSGVSGDLAAGVGPVDVLRATFPHGTVSGAPKVRAMEIIDALEPTARGPYAGAVGYIDFNGNLDTAIGLRTCVARGTTAWVQAGAGIVADSIPAAEYDECVNKAMAVLAAIAGADELARR